MVNLSSLAEPIVPLPLPKQRTDAELFANDPLLSAGGLGKELWDEHADAYFARLREEW